jgi:hypothetical protein
MSTPPTTRLYGVMAREAPVAVLVRHGPSKRAQIIKWDTDTDKFDQGQWLKGQIASATVGLSPDGSLMVYSATDHGRRRPRLPSDSGEWTAVSKPPYLTALVIWFHKGPTSYKWDGGFFETNRLLKLDFVWNARKPDRLCPIPQDVQIVGTKGKSAPDEIMRLAGWEPGENPDSAVLQEGLGLSPGSTARDHEAISAFVQHLKSSPARLCVWAKKVGEVHLIRNQHLGKRLLDLRHALEPDTGLDLDGADWADFDQQGRLVFARFGKVFGARREGDAWDVRELADFTQNRFEAIEAPDWAKVW